MRKKERGLYEKTWEDPLLLTENCPDDPEKAYFTYADTITRQEDGRADAVRLEDMSAVNELEAHIEKYGIRELNGYDKSKPLPEGQLDGDSGFRLYVEYSDGTVISSRGSNIAPRNWNDFSNDVYELFVKYINEYGEG